MRLPTTEPPLLARTIYHAEDSPLIWIIQTSVVALRSRSLGPRAGREPGDLRVGDRSCDGPVGKQKPRDLRGFRTDGHNWTRTSDLSRVNCSTGVREVAICRAFAGEGRSAYAGICGDMRGIRP